MVCKNIRSAIEFLKKRNKLLVAQREVDPVYEISGIQKALDGGPAILFENIKGYPGVRNIGNIFASEEQTAALFDVEQFRQLKFRCLAAVNKPLPPRIIKQAPCQEVIITSDIDMMATLPIIKHAEDDAAKILGGGILLVTAVPGGEGNDISFKRIHFKGEDWGSVYIGPNTHLDYIINNEHRGEKVPLTINIGAPPAVTLIAAARPAREIAPHGMDELGIAGALQDAPVEICRAITVETYAIAESEWVIEGYIMPEPCWETDAAEKAGINGATFLFPEWHGYQGTAVTGNTLQITAITHRKDRPIFYTPLADSYEAENITHPFAEASLFHLTHGMAPGLVLDVNAPHAFKQAGGLVIQIKKTSPDDDNIVRDVILAALKASRRSLVIAVDEDVDIYSSADILWAMMTRGIADSQISRITPGGAHEVDKTNIPSRSGGIVAMDATLPFAARKSFKRAHYPVDRIQLNKWFSEPELIAARSLQGEYAGVLSRLGA